MQTSSSFSSEPPTWSKWQPLLQGLARVHSEVTESPHFQYFNFEAANMSLLLGHYSAELVVQVSSATCCVDRQKDRVLLDSDSYKLLYLATKSANASEFQPSSPNWVNAVTAEAILCGHIGPNDKYPVFDVRRYSFPIDLTPFHQKSEIYDKLLSSGVRTMGMESLYPFFNGSPFKAISNNLSAGMFAKHITTMLGEDFMPLATSHVVVRII